MARRLPCIFLLPLLLVFCSLVTAEEQNPANFLKYGNTDLDAVVAMLVRKSGRSYEVPKLSFISNYSLSKESAESLLENVLALYSRKSIQNPDGKWRIVQERPYAAGKIPRYLIVRLKDLDSLTLDHDLNGILSNSAEIKKIDSLTFAISDTPERLSLALEQLASKYLMPYNLPELNSHNVAIQPLNEVKISIQEFESLIGDRTKFLAAQRVVPYFENSKEVGVRVFALRRESIFAKMGMMNGDVCIIDADKYPSFFEWVTSFVKALSAKREGSLTIVRGRSKFQLTIKAED